MEGQQLAEDQAAELIKDSGDGPSPASSESPAKRMKGELDHEGNQVHAKMDLNAPSQPVKIGPGRRSPREVQPSFCQTPRCKSALTDEEKARRLVNCGYHRGRNAASSKRSRENKKLKVSTFKSPISLPISEADESFQKGKKAKTSEASSSNTNA